MSRLVLLNGPPAIGKSTCARRWAATREDAVVVDIDELRTSLPGWQHDEGSKVKARRMAIALVAEHLLRGSEVIVPQYVGRTEFIDELGRTAREAGAQFVEVLLKGDIADVVARFDARRAHGAPHPEHEVEDVTHAIREASARLERVAQARPDCAVVEVDSDPDTTMARLTLVLDGR